MLMRADTGIGDCSVPNTTHWSLACKALAFNAASHPVGKVVGRALFPNATDADADALEHLANRVKNVLHHRRLLCSSSRPCAVSGITGQTTSKLKICPPIMSRVFCAPFASERSSRFERALAEGCLAPPLPCQTFDLGRIAHALDTLRSSRSFYGPGDLDEAFVKLKRREKDRTQLAKVMQSLAKPEAQSHNRCALAGANHMMRCRNWGAHLDDPTVYDAVFRVNGFQLDEARIPNQWLNPRYAGRRTTYRQSCMTLGQRLNSSRSETCILTPDFLSAQSTHTDHTQVCGGPRLRSEYTESSVAAAVAQGYRFLLFGREAPYSGLVGTGSGDAAFLAALALCRELDVYGVGLHGRYLTNDTIEAVYQHAYDPGLGKCKPDARNVPCAKVTRASLVSAQFEREMHWAVWHALGLANWRWS